MDKAWVDEMQIIQKAELEKCEKIIRDKLKSTYYFDNECLNRYMNDIRKVVKMGLYEPIYAFNYNVKAAVFLLRTQNFFQKVQTGR